MHVLGAGHRHVLHDRHLEPALRVQAGSEIQFETLDACWGKVRSIEQLKAYWASKQASNPLTGPVYVEGARPGDVLAVHILAIELDATGFQLIGPKRGVIIDEVEQWECFVVHAAGGRIRLDNGLEFAAQPVVGSLGVAPAAESTNRPGPWGGNLDVPQIGVGSTVLLPVQVDGALFSLGDVHARQGDGELVGAPEIGARVTVRLELMQQPDSAGWPMVRAGGREMLVSTAASEAQAIRIGALAAGGFLSRRHGIRLQEALVALTMLAQVHCARTGTWGEHGPVACTLWREEEVAAAVQKCPRR